MSDDTILLVGATGRFAGLVLPALARSGVRPRALVRDAAQADAVRARGAGEVAIADLRDPASLRAALHGVGRVFYVSPVFQPDEAEIGVRFVRLAAEAGARRIVFSSVVHPSLGLANHASKRPIEDAIFASGLDHVILRPAVLFQNLAAAWPRVAASGVLAEPFSAASRIARVDYRDVAEIAATALTTDDLLGGSFELAADGGLDRGALAAFASEAAGRPVAAAAPTFEEWARETGLPPDAPQRAPLAAMYAHYDRHGLRASPVTLRALLGRAPRTLPAFFADLAAGRPVTAS